MKKFLAITALMTAVAAPAMANMDKDPAKKEAMIKAKFDKLDTNKDGKISEDEYENHKESKFDAADKNNDDSLSYDEFKSAKEEKWAEKKEKHSSSKAANANPTEHSANSTNPSQHHE